MKQIRFALVSGLLPVLLLGLCFPAASATVPASALSGKVVLVSLGDSICRGYGLPEPEEQRYSTLLSQQIAKLPGVRSSAVYNYGVDGQTSGELLALLRDTPAEELHLPDADVITVSIGANDALRHGRGFFDALSRMREGEDVNLSDILLKYLSDVAGSLDTLRENVTQILSVLRECNPDAQIVLQTVYNPYRPSDGGSAVDTLRLPEIAGSVVSLLNGVLTGVAGSAGVTVADVAAAFAAAPGELTNQDRGFDPHPTPGGHELIAKTIRGVLH